LLRCLAKYLPQNLVIKSDGEELVSEKAMGLFDRLKALLPEFNATLAKKYSMDSEDFLYDIIDTYVNSDKTENLEKMYAEKNWKQYGIDVHAIKSSSLTIGFPKLSGEAAELEAAAKAGDSESVMHAHGTFMSHYKSIIEGLSRVVK